ncbi:unnamed protein product [Closterium sp. NIES-54]
MPHHSQTIGCTNTPHAPAAPLAGAEAGPTAPAAVPSAPPASPSSLAPLVEPSASAPAGGVAEPPAPVPGARVAPDASAPCLPAQASASSPKAASATTGEPDPSVAPTAVGQSAPAVMAVVLAGQPSRPPSPDRRSSRPHSPAPHQDRKSSRRRRESPRRYQKQWLWPAHPGGQGDRRGSRARGGDPQPIAAPPPQVQALPAPSPAVSAPAPGSRLHLPPVPPVAGVEFVAADGGSLVALFALSADADEPLQFLAEALQPPQTRRDSCLDAADQLAVLLAPVLAAPVEGGAASAGQLDEAVRGLRRHLRVGSGAAAISASTLAVRELWRSLTGVLHALGAHRM